ncbi:QacE family quaternary ammonium compound efflux SMR transporter [Actinorhabdospora filicis]|uniref:QacE family quaternary ammonium compound efflux SMR transporter n=1 Tax=Actinorhabdospora filicis TaxID=1785913 RepID=A0A9W6SLX3_9ACTN|nr:multidrug efflux SMR transporter [Actinorhabdospora filicis]GLZ78197.1 QacE family quaternary ammonium compound efflux SMR transporter [Actinorhabdospora filicis]
MPWLILLASAVFEAVWATALGRSDGLSRPVPTAVFVVTLVISMLGLAWAVKHIPIATAYAVWTGIGAALTVGFAMVTGAEAVSVWKLVFIAGIVGAVAGLKLLPKPPGRSTGSRGPGRTRRTPPRG